MLVTKKELTKVLVKVHGEVDMLVGNMAAWMDLCAVE